MQGAGLPPTSPLAIRNFLWAWILTGRRMAKPGVGLVAVDDAEVLLAERIPEPIGRDPLPAKRQRCDALLVPRVPAMMKLPFALALFSLALAANVHSVSGVFAAPLDVFETDGPIDVSVSRLLKSQRIGEGLYSTDAKEQTLHMNASGGRRDSNAFYHVQNHFFSHAPNENQTSGFEVNEGASTAIIPCLLAGQRGSRHHRVTYFDFRGTNASGNILLGNFAFELSDAENAKPVVIRLYTRVKRAARHRPARIPAALRASYHPAGHTNAPFVASVDTLKTDVAKVMTTSDAVPRPGAPDFAGHGGSEKLRGGHAALPE